MVEGKKVMLYTESMGDVEGKKVNSGNISFYKKNGFKATVLYAAFAFISMSASVFSEMMGSGLDGRYSSLFYYSREFALVAGYLLCSFLADKVSGFIKKLIGVFMVIGFIIPIVLSYYISDPIISGIPTVVCMYFVGMLGCFVLNHIAHIYDTPLSICLGGAIAVVMQWICQIKCDSDVITLILIILFFILCDFTVTGFDVEAVSEEKDSAGSKGGYLIFIPITLCLYAFYPFYEVFATDMFVKSVLYESPRLFLAAGYILMAVICVKAKRMVWHVSVLCMAVITVLLPVFAGLGEAAFISASLFYLTLGVVFAYCNVLFVSTALKMKHTAFWASMGRILDGLITVAGGLFVLMTNVSPLCACVTDIIILAVLIALMVFGGCFTGDKNETKGKEPEEDSNKMTMDEICEKFSFTPREAEIFNILVSTEKKNQEIADDLEISRRSLQTHISSIYEKTGVNSRAGLILLIK